MLPDLTHVKVAALDTETYDPKLLSAGPGFLRGWGSYMIGFSYAHNGGYDYVPTKHSHGNFEGDWKSWLIELVSDPERTIVFANAKYDLEVLWSEGINVKSKIQDIQTLDALINENYEQFSLAAICERRGLPSKATSLIEKELLDRGFSIRGKPDLTRLKDLPVEIVKEYGELDASLTLGCYLQQLDDIERDGLNQVADLESALHPILWDMRKIGVRVDVGAAENLNYEYQCQNIPIIQDIIERSSVVEPWSSDSLAAWVRNLGFEPPKTKKDNDSISNEWLLGQNHELLTKMAEYRQSEKIRRDFIEGLVIYNSTDGRVHPNWFSTRGGNSLSGGDGFAGTRTGRIACIDPNLTQIPARHPVYGAAVRGLFLPEIDERWAKFDFKTQEPRITVHYAYVLGMPGAAEIRDVYINNPSADYHQATADLILRVTGLAITRSQAKTINLALAYGLGKKKLALRLNLPLDQAEAIIRAYNQAIRFIQQLLNYCNDMAASRGYVRTILGRRRHFDEWEKLDTRTTKWEKPIRDKEIALRQWGRIKRAGTYKALNAIIQGSAAEQTKTAMVNIYKQGKTPLVQVYDELGYSVSSDNEIQMIKDNMINAIQFSVPHDIDVDIGPCWSAK